MRAVRIFLPLSLAAMVLAGCAPAAVSQSDLDTPEYHYRLGMRSLDDGDYSTARSAFQRAVDLDKKFAIGWGGLGLTQAYMGDAEAGEASVDKGIKLNGQSAAAQIFRGRFFIVIQNGKWFAEAQKSLNRALALDRGNERANYYLGEANFYQTNFRAAEAYFGGVVEMSGEMAGKADERWATTQKIIRARPGSDASKKIAIKAEISRADLAVLFSEELKLKAIFARASSGTSPQATFQPPGAAAAAATAMTVPADVKGSWAEPWIKESLELGVFEADPSGNFYPAQAVTRVDYAMAVQRILTKVTGDSSLDTKYFGESTSRFNDVPASHFAYNAMALAAERGIMKADMMTGNFNPSGAVGGADALLIIREIQNSLRITF